MNFEKLLAWYIFYRMDEMPVGTTGPETIEGWIVEFRSRPITEVLRELEKEYKELREGGNYA